MSTSLKSTDLRIQSIIFWPWPPKSATPRVRLARPPTLASLPPSAWKYVIVVVLGVAGLIGLIAVILANKAAEGFPKVEQDIPLTGPQMAAVALDGAKRSRKLLRQAILGAAIAGTLAIVGSFGILAVGLLSPTPAPTVVVVTPSGAYCGTLSTTNGATSVLLSSGKLISAKAGTITVVTSCGGS